MIDVSNSGAHLGALSKGGFGGGLFLDPVVVKKKQQLSEDLGRRRFQEMALR